MSFLARDNLSLNKIKTESDLSQCRTQQNSKNADMDTDKFKQIVTKAVGESAVENIEVIRSGIKPDGTQQLIKADTEGTIN